MPLGWCPGISTPGYREGNFERDHPSKYIYINTSLGAEAPVQQILVARIGRRSGEFLVGVVKEKGRNSRKERHR